MNELSGLEAASPAPPPAYPEHVRSVLEQAIIDGVLDPGQRITEGELSEMLGVSRTPVREAMRILEARGLIIRRANRGTHIASRTTRPEAEALYRLRIPLEGYLASCAAERITPEVIATLDQLQAKFRESLEAGEVARQELIRLDSDFHWTIFRAADSDLSSIVGSYWGRLLRELSARTYSSEPPKRFAMQHEAIIAALSDHDADRSAALTREHIETSWQAASASYSSDEETGGAQP